MTAKNLKRYLLVLGIALLLPGAAGAADFGARERTFWEDGAALFTRVWEGLTSAWLGGSIEPNGGTNAGGSIEPNGGTNAGGSIDPNGTDLLDSAGSIDPNG